MVQITVNREPLSPTKEKALVLWFEEVGIADIPLVGGKNASLGEMIQQLGQKGVRELRKNKIPIKLGQS